MAEDAPSGTITVAGVVTKLGIPTEILISHPPTGAGPDKVTVAMEVPPPPMVLGLNVKLVMESPTTVRDALAPVFPSVT